jgi:site-specific DNA-adenine methylase
LYTDPDLNEDQFDERFRQSLDNTFLIFTGQRTYLEILLDQSRPQFFFFDPEMVPTKEDVLDLIYIYEDFEEYEKCGELLNLVNQFE